MAAALIRRKATIVADFVGNQLQRTGRSLPAATPLMVSMQGPQGSGKSSIAAALVDVLDDRGVRCTVASLDDFYLPHTGLKELAATHNTNKLLQGRGPPGTHDVPLLSEVLSALRSGNATELPVFDKSAHSGQGDRSHTVPVEAGSVDVFVLEGWSLGFGPIPAGKLRQLHPSGPNASSHPLSSMEVINEKLAEIQAATEGMFDAHVGIRPPHGDYAVVYDWRLEQEHKMKAKNGGKGMSDDEVRRFVDRYMPVYEVWGDEVPDRPSLWIELGRERELVRVWEVPAKQ